MRDEPFETRTFAAENLKFLNVKTFRGDIEIVGHESDTVEILTFGSVRNWENLFFKTELRRNNENHTLFMLDKSGESWNLKTYESPGFWDTLSFYSVSFLIRLPKNVATQLTTTFGRISISDSNANHRFSTTVGGLVVSRHSGRLDGRSSGGNIRMWDCNSKGELSTKGGNVSVLDSKGDLNVKTAGGNITINKFVGKIYSNTYGGNIKASEVNGDFKTSTSGGNITLTGMKGNVGASTSGGRVRAEVLAIHEYLWLETMGGTVSAQIPLNQGLYLDLKAEKIKMPRLQNFNGEISRRRVIGALNGSGANVSLKTSGGTISVDQVIPRFDIPEPVIPKEEPQSWRKEGIVSEEDFPKTPGRAFVRPQVEKKNSYEKLNSSKSWGKETLGDMVYALAFISLFVYGLNSLIYFSMQMTSPSTESSSQNIAVFLSNITAGFAVFLSGLIFIHYIESRIGLNWMKYVVMTSLSYGFLFIIQTFQWIMYKALNDGQPFWGDYWRMVRPDEYTKYSPASLMYLSVPAIVSCVYFYTWQRSKKMNRKITEQEYQLLNLEKLKTKAQLNALEAKINPHFLYNSLNSIASLIHENPDKAEEMTIQLSKLFRYTTGRTEQNYHTISEELEIVKTYLAIEQTRFGNRLKFQISIDEELENIMIPRFLLQPLVENAIKHGISKMTGEGLIEVKVSHNGDFVEFLIHDNGPGFEEGLGGGYGLRSIKDKLNLIYGNQASFEILNDGYKAVFLKLPIVLPNE